MRRSLWPEAILRRIWSERIMAAPDMPNASVSSDEPVIRVPPARVYRHRLPVRLWHWVNAVTLLVLLMSGLMIFNAHPRLYWGQAGANHDYRSEEHTSELQSLMRISYAVFCL